MAKFIRYALATVCFAASVACLALWGWSKSEPTIMRRASHDTPAKTIALQFHDGIGIVGFIGRSRSAPAKPSWYFNELGRSGRIGGVEKFEAKLSKDGIFGTTNTGVHFPLWYPALVFTLAGVAALRFRRQFSVRSALIAVGVVAALLGMVAVL